MVCRHSFNRAGHRTQPLIGVVGFAWVSLGFPFVSLAAPRTAQAPLPPLSPGAGVSSAARADDFYTLGAGDRVRVDVFGLPEYSGENQVLSDGTLTVPLIGSVNVEGLTLSQASREMERRYAAFLKTPVITIIILSTRPVKIAVAGEVDRPGVYAVGSTTTAGAVGPVQGANIITITGAIQLAGGLKQSADISKIQVRRAPTRVGGQRMYSLDLRQLLQSADNSQDLLLRDGDSLFIPSTEGFPSLEDTLRLANSGLVSQTPRPVKIALVGEVYRPGPYTLNTGVQSEATGGQGTVGRQSVPGQGASDRVPTLTKAIQLAGGITQMADVRRIKVRRIAQSGATQEVEVDFWKLLQDGTLNQDVPLQDGDTVLIPTATALSPEEALKLGNASFSPATISIYVVGVDTLRADGRPLQFPPNTPLMQAVMAVGGRSPRASKNIELVRFNPDGTVIQRRYKFDLSKNLGDEGNPPLRNNDVIIVRRSTIAKIGDALGQYLPPIINLLGGYNTFRTTVRDGGRFDSSDD